MKLPRNLDADTLIRHLARRCLFLALLLSVGCHRAYAPPEAPLPPNTVMLSQMMRELSARPGFTEAMLAQLDKGGNKKGPALLTPALVDDLRKRILGKDWSRLDRFPGWTMREINPTVRVAGHIAGKSEALEGMSAVHPGAASAMGDKEARAFLDLGPYALDRAETVSLDAPSKLPGFSTAGIVSDLGGGVTRGDGPNPQPAPEHAESQRMADVLNRLAANRLNDSPLFGASLHLGSEKTGTIEGMIPGTLQRVRDPETMARRPEELIANLERSGHTVTVIDARYFANFGHLHYKGQDVMMPFFVDSGVLIPDSGGRHLLVPVTHAEYEWQIRGPKINADVSYYFGIDGKSEWRVMDTQDQPWVLKRAAHTYTGEQAVEVTRLASLLTVAYMHLHAAHATLPFGGYYALGVCQDGVSAIERKMTGQVTLFPNTADAALFTDPRDAEANALITAIPKDRSGAPPEPERIFGSLPADPGPNGDFAAITIPGLGDDLRATYAAWRNGSVRRAHGGFPGTAIAALALAFVVLLLLRRRRRA